MIRREVALELLLLLRFLKPTSSLSLESWCFNSLALRLRTFPMSSRSLRSASTDIEARLLLTIFHLQQGANTAYCHSKKNELDGEQAKACLYHIGYRVGLAYIK